MMKQYRTIPILYMLSMILISGCGGATNQIGTEDINIKSGNNNDQVQMIENDINEEMDMSGLVIRIKEAIHPSLPEFLFKVYGEEKGSTYAANKIEIYQSEEEDGEVQEILLEETDTPDKESLGFIIEDMNFDGYRDIRIQQSLSASPNISYYYWLWDKTSSKYVSNASLEMIMSPEFDNKNKWIKSYVRDNAVTYYEDIYKYIDEVPTLVKETEEIIDEKNKVTHITIMEFSYNEMNITKKYDEPLGND
jgi:hypothetical protein